MRRPGQYANPNIRPNMMPPHAAQRAELNSGSSHFPRRPDSYHSEEDKQYVSPKEGQWSRSGARGPNSLSHANSEGQAADASRPPYHGQWPESRQYSDSKSTAREQEMDVRHDGSSLEPTLESIERKFYDEITKLTKEQQDSEDAENARHRQKLTEINTRYEEQLVAMRARQAVDRDNFLRNETQGRHDEYQQQVNMSTYQSTAGPAEFHGYSMPEPDVAQLGEPNRAYAGGRGNSYRDQHQYSGPTRDRGFDSRGPYPGGRAYNSGGRRF